MSYGDGIKWHAFMHVDKYDPALVEELTRHLGHEPTAEDIARLGVDASSVSETDGNLIVTVGLTRITSLITGSGLALTNTTMRTAVGNSTTAALVGDTDLNAAAGSTNRWHQIMDATYPQTSAGIITARSTFGTSDGNFAWEEWGWDVNTATVTSTNSKSTATLINHKVGSNGTKPNGAIWIASSTVTLS